MSYWTTDLVFIVTTFIYLRYGLRGHKCLDQLIIFTSLYIIGTFVPFLLNRLYFHFSGGSWDSVFFITSSNVLLFIMLWRIFFQHANSTNLVLLSSPRYSNGYKSLNVKIPKILLWSVLLIRLIQIVFELLKSIISSTGITKTEAWEASVRIEEQTGTGASGLLFMLFVSFYYFVLISALRNSGQESSRILKIFMVTEFVHLIKILVFSLYRSPLVFELIQIFIVYQFFYKEIPIRKIRLTAGIFLLVLPFYFSAAGYARDGRLDEGLAKMSLSTGLSGVATSFEFMDLYDRVNRGDLSLENGKQFGYNFISFIPRFLWQNKPFTSFSYRISTDLYGQMGVDGWVHTYTLWGEGYLQFGVFGSYLATLLLVLLLRVLYLLTLLMPQFIGVFTYLMLTKFPILTRGDLSSFYGVGYKIMFSLIFCIFITVIFNSLFAEKRRTE